MAADQPPEQQVARHLLALVRRLSQDRAESEAFVDRYLAVISAGDDRDGVHASVTRLARGILTIACAPGHGVFDLLLEEAGGAR